MNANRADSPTGSLVWNLVLPYGKWDGREGQEYGPKEGAAMIQYFEKSHKASGRALVIDYEHRSLDGVEAPASGWIWDLKEFLDADPPGVYMLNEWTPRAKAAIDANEYKYLSPVIATDYEDPTTGEKIPFALFNAALTNTPFMFDKMPAVKAASLCANNNAIQNATMLQININGDTMDPQQQLIDAAVAKLGGQPGMTKDMFLQAADSFGKVVKILEQLEGLLGTQEAPTAGTPQPEGNVPATPEAMTPEVMDAMGAKMNSAIVALKAKAANADDAASYLSVNAAELTKTIIAMKGSGETVSRTEFDALQNRLSKQNADAFMAKNAEKIPPAKRDWFRNKAVSNLSEAEELVSMLTEKLPDTVVTVETKNSTAPDPIVVKGLKPSELKFYLNSLGIAEAEHQNAIKNLNNNGGTK